MESHLSSIRYNIFDTIFLMSEFGSALSSTVTYVNVPTVSAHKTNKQLQATSQGQFCLHSFSDVKKAKGNGLPVHYVAVGVSETWTKQPSFWPLFSAQDYST